jgi:hypothetical protein
VDSLGSSRISTGVFGEGIFVRYRWVPAAAEPGCNKKPLAGEAGGAKS